ncbi:MAG: DUF1501 domain-containing protein [Planctomycetaceae bacterium]
MLSLLQQPVRLCDGQARRRLLQIGGLSSLGLHLPGFWQLPKTQAASPLSSRPAAKAKACIILFLMGGPPQHSTFDPKPQAPREIRGAYGPIATAVPGLQLCELWPRTALVADRLAVLRAMSTGDNAHSSSGYYMMTGVPHAPMNAENANPGFPNDSPHLGAIARRLLAPQSQLPAAIRLPHRIFNTDGSVWPGQDAGYLGRAVEPWLLNCQPASDAAKIDEFLLSHDIDDRRLKDRRQLLKQLAPAIPGTLVMENAGWDQLADRAFDVLGSSPARQAFELDRESTTTRDRYGRSQFGQSVLMSRRLVEAGVSLVQVNWYRGADEPSDAPCWDSHARETQRLKDVLCPSADQALAALLEDLSERGLLDETLVVVMSEFGRTPRMNGGGGRDHWGHVFSAAMAGGGIQGGAVYGASDEIGGFAKENKTSPQDLTATIFHCLGIDPHAVIHDTLGRPIPISRGEVIQGILA